MRKRKLRLEILPTVYAPREDSCLLIKALKVKPKEKILEIGTGSGVIAIHCAKAGANVTATDITQTRCLKRFCESDKNLSANF